MSFVKVHNFNFIIEREGLLQACMCQISFFLKSHAVGNGELFIFIVLSPYSSFLGLALPLQISHSVSQVGQVWKLGSAVDRAVSLESERPKFKSSFTLRSTV